MPWARRVSDAGQPARPAAAGPGRRGFRRRRFRRSRRLGRDGAANVRPGERLREERQSAGDRRSRRARRGAARRRGRRGKGAIGGGALALLGTLAMQALQKNWGQQQTPTDPNALAREAPLGLRAPQNAREEQELDQRALLMVRAMINAAKADGEIDRQEIERISAKLGDAASDQEARAFLVQEMQQPSDIDGITRQVSSPELAVQVYAASLLAIEVDTPGRAGLPARPRRPPGPRCQRDLPGPPGAGGPHGPPERLTSGEPCDGGIGLGCDRRCPDLAGVRTADAESIVYLRDGPQTSPPGLTELVGRDR